MSCGSSYSSCFYLLSGSFAVLTGPAWINDTCALILPDFDTNHQMSATVSQYQMPATVAQLCCACTRMLEQAQANTSLCMVDTESENTPYKSIHWNLQQK